MERTERIPVFNVDFKIEGWKGPFDKISDFMLAAKLALPWELYANGFSVLGKGKINYMKVKGLHTYEGSMNLIEDDHIHLRDPSKGLSWILGVAKREDGIHLRGGSDLFRAPQYTLAGLYEATKSESTSSKLAAISRRLDILGKVLPGEKIDTYTLKQMEDVYRERISDQ